MDERELTALIEAERPSPDVVFVAELDERVRQGFPRERKLDRVRTALAARDVTRPSLAVVGGFASLLIAVVVAVSLSTGGNGDGPVAGLSQGDGSASAPVMPESLPTTQETGGGKALDAVQDRDAIRSSLRDQSLASQSPLARRGFAPGTRDRRIRRSATLTIAAPDDRLDRVAGDITKITERYRGFVLSSSLATGDEGVTTGGSFELQIPAARLQPALADLGDLGQVRARTQNGDDVTAAFVTAGDRLQAARAERRSLLGRLEQADTDVEAESLRLQLDANAGEVNRLRGQIRRLRISTDYATVSVALEARDGEAAPPGDGLGGAIDDALDSLGDSLELAIRALGVLLPLALLAAVLTLIARATLRRRRESALAD
jgi:hypothetical protein